MPTPTATHSASVPLPRLCRGPLVAAALILIAGHSLADDGQPRKYPTCTNEPTENDVSAAKGAYKAGQVSFQEADYERALLYWEDAFRRDCTAIKLLLNIARAYELSGDRRAAVHALRVYLERQEDDQDREAVEKRIARLEERIAEEAAVAPPEPEPLEAQPSPAETAASQPAGSEPDSPRRYPAWPVLLTAGGGAVLVAGGVLISLGAAAVNTGKDQVDQDFPNCTRDGRKWDCITEEDVDEVQEALHEELKNPRAVRTLGYVAAGAGAIATAVGATYWAILWRKVDKSSVSPPVTFAPVFTPGYQGIQLNGRF